MFAAISRSWELTKASYRVLRSDPELLVLPLISMLGVILISIVFFVPAWLSGLLENLATDETRSGGSIALGVILLFLFYLVMYTVVIYCNVALVGAAMMRMRGQDPTVSDGLRIADGHLRQIVGYAAISATVGVILSMLRGNSDNIVGRIIAGLIGIAWNVVTFLVVPVLVVDNVGPVEAVKRSGSLLRRTWGEQIIANTGIGLVLGLATVALILVVGVPLVALAVATESMALILTVVGVVVILVALISVFGSALNGVFQAALYNYATTGQTGGFFSQGQVAGAFRLKTRWPLE